MKTALCLYGMGYDYAGKIINVERSYIAIKREILSKYETDVFCHLWIDQPENPNLAQIKSLYQPKSIMVENNDDFLAKIREGKTVTKRIRPKEYSHFYSMYTSNQLRIKHQEESKTKYDLLIITRYDLNFSINVDLQKYLGTNKLYLVDRPKSSKRAQVQNFTYCMDCFFMSDEEKLINTMCEIFNDLEFHAKKKTSSIHHGVGIHLRKTGLIKDSILLNPRELYCMVYPDYYATARRLEYQQGKLTRELLEKLGYVHDRE